MGCFTPTHTHTHTCLCIDAIVFDFILPADRAGVGARDNAGKARRRHAVLCRGGRHVPLMSVVIKSGRY